MFDDIAGKILRFFNRNDKTKELEWSRSNIYKRRVEQLKYGWIAAGIIILIFASLPVTIFVVLISLFTSLAFLEPDDTDE